MEGKKKMKELFEWAILVMSICVITCTMMKYWWAPIVGFLHEIPWAGYAIYAKSLPIFITSILYAVVFALSIRKWYKEKRIDNYQLCPGCLEFTKERLRIGKELCFNCRTLNRQEINHEERR